MRVKWIYIYVNVQQIVSKSQNRNGAQIIFIIKQKQVHLLEIMHTHDLWLFFCSNLRLANDQFWISVSFLLGFPRLKLILIGAFYVIQTQSTAMTTHAHDLCRILYAHLDCVMCAHQRHVHTATRACIQNNAIHCLPKFSHTNRKHTHTHTYKSVHTSSQNIHNWIWCAIIAGLPFAQRFQQQ